MTIWRDDDGPCVGVIKTLTAAGLANAEVLGHLQRAQVPLPPWSTARTWSAGLMRHVKRKHGIRRAGARNAPASPARRAQG